MFHDKLIRSNITMGLPNQVIIQLIEQLTCSILKKLPDVTDIGLYNGRSGIALYLFHYSKYTADETCRQVALNVVNKLSDELTIDSPLGYTEGLAGFGTLMEYLAQNQFITINTDEALEDIDQLLYYHLTSCQVNSLDNVLSFGKYYNARINDPFNSKNIQNVSELLDLLDTPFNTYNHIYNIIDFLSTAYLYVADKAKAGDYLRYAIDKMETMANEDAHFGVSSTAFNPVLAALQLTKAGIRMKDNFYSQKAKSFLELGTKIHHQPTNFNNDINNSFKSHILYRELFSSYKKPVYREASITHQLMFVKENVAYLERWGHPNSHIGSGDITKFAINGLALMGLLYPNDRQWEDLFLYSS